jgi:riboflavin kinase/FMN adenylyltransferase
VLRLNRIEQLADLEGPLHLALGVFDGVHVGHRAVIGRALVAAKAKGGLTVVVTFDPHPIRVLAPEKAPRALLATLDHKAHLLAELGVDALLAISFDETFAKVEAEDFLESLCISAVKTLAVGEDWRFGHARRGDVAMLQRFSKTHGFTLEAVPPVMADGERISSTRIRQAIRDGNVSGVAAMLGRPYSIEGIVREGRKLGRELGFPTANLLPGDVQMPSDGVWVVRVAVDGMQYGGVANLGFRPTVDGEAHLLEVHLFDFAQDLYGANVEVTFLDYIRAEKKFSSLDELKAQIACDAVEARRVLGI